MVGYRFGKARREHPSEAVIIMLRTILTPDSADGVSRWVARYNGVFTG